MPRYLTKDYLSYLRFVVLNSRCVNLKKIETNFRTIQIKKIIKHIEFQHYGFSNLENQQNPKNKRIGPFKLLRS